jgi:DNA-binding transcriptional MerR regulator
VDERLILPGEAAELLGVSTRMLAHYEQKSVLRPAIRLQRSAHWGVRLYRLDDVMKLARERKMAGAGNE